MRGTVIYNFNGKREKQGTRQKKLPTVLQIASGLPQTNRIKLATCVLGCLFHFLADVAFFPPRLHKAGLPFVKTQCISQANLGLPGWLLSGPECPSSEHNVLKRKSLLCSRNRHRAGKWLVVRRGGGNPPLPKLCQLNCQRHVPFSDGLSLGDCKDGDLLSFPA